MRFSLGFLSVLLTSLGCYSFTKYRSELLSFPDLKAQVLDDFDVYEIKEHGLKLALNFQFKKLDLKLTNNSDESMSFLPLDLNLGTSKNRCSIKEIFEGTPRKKVNFGTKYVLAEKTTHVFSYLFSCKKNPESFLTINGLKQNNKKIVLNFRFSEK